MAVNHMAEVAAMFGVELGEEFEINENPGVQYKFDSLMERLLYLDAYDGWWTASSDIIKNLIYGLFTIKRKPCRPKDGDFYWFVDACGNVLEASWDGYIDNMNDYKLGNCYRTKEEAEANREKWVAFYASDEVLEV